MKRRMKSGKKTGIYPFLFGIFTCAICYATLIFIFAIFAYFSGDPTKNLQIFSLIAIPLSGAVCGFLITKKCEGRYRALLYGATLSVILIIAGVLVNKSVPNFSSFLNTGIYLGCILLFSILTGRREKRHRTRR